jgi:hypothetical protein
MATASWIQIMDNAFEALVFNRFKTYLSITDSNADLTFAPKELAQRLIAEKRAKNTTEFISVWRDGVAFDWTRQRSPAARKGFQMEYVDSNRTSLVTVKAVPAVMNYKFCIWSRDLNKITTCVESYLKWVHDYPNMQIFYSGLYEMDMYLKFGECTDVTDYNIWEKGKHFVFQFPVSMEGWVLTSVTSPTILKIIIDVFLREGTAPNYRDTFVNEYIIEATEE